MSYLLTEIALDMLGYKFYDINGTYHITDFQSMSNSASNDSQEASLEQIIYPDDVRIGRLITEAISTDSDECIEIPSTPAPRSSTNHEQLVMLNIKESVNKEVESLREEIYHSKAKFIEENIKVFKKKDKTANITTKDLLKPYNERERRNIRGEAEMLSEFLKCVEKRLEEANPEQFKEIKKYSFEELL